ncbi:MAG: hypothetical protein ACLFUJ_13860 [Phycisphaerae bacterium]
MNESNKTASTGKPTLWVLLSHLERPDIAFAISTLAWMAEESGALLECYLHARRDGRLFARTGSTVLGGHHHQQFNYLCAAFDVRPIVLGSAPLWTSTLDVFGLEPLARADDLPGLYDAILCCTDATAPDAVLLGPDAPHQVDGQQIDTRPYLFPEIHFRRALGLSVSDIDGLADRQTAWGHLPVLDVALTSAQRNALRQSDVKSTPVEDEEFDGYARFTVRTAERWKKHARAVAFGDPAAILSQLPRLCREKRVAVYAPTVRMAPADVKVSEYTEATSAVVHQVADLAEQLGDRRIIGRQTCDGDILTWSRRGVAIEIIDPNRPAFPVVATREHRWAQSEVPFDADEPDDAELERWADEGKILTSLVWHSGEPAHNEAMLNLFDLAARTGVKMGMGVLLSRYRTCPQQWEMLSVPREAGGVRGLIEPLLHCGGMGILAEAQCPPDLLAEHCFRALEGIEKIAGPSGRPRGYYAFLDTDLQTLTKPSPGAWDAIASTRLQYVISSMSPGRNRLLHHDGNFVVINQTSRSICPASPFVRVTTVEDFTEYAPKTRPGWLIGALDAPVVAFDSYIWRHGRRFLDIVEFLAGNDAFVNVLPCTIARYARILERKKFLPSRSGPEAWSLS